VVEAAAKNSAVGTMMEWQKKLPVVQAAFIDEGRKQRGAFAVTEK